MGRALDRAGAGLAGVHAADAGPAGIVARVVAVLRAVAGAEGSIAIKRLAAGVLPPPSTVHRILDQRAAAGMIERAPGRRYRASAEFARIRALAATPELAAPGTAACHSTECRPAARVARGMAAPYSASGSG